MHERELKLRAIILVLHAFCALAVFFVPLETGRVAHAYLKVDFLDIGQGDSILIEAPGGRQVLIDGGPDGTVLERLSEVMPFGDHSIDMVVGTHPDKDHIGGLIDVLRHFDVGTILTTENRNDTQASAMYESLKEKEGAQIVNARRGMLFTLDASTTLRVLYPDRDPSAMESNESSIVLQLRYGSTTFLFTGDSPKDVEAYLVANDGANLRSTVLKAGHHGSRSATSELYLDAVDPQYAIISAGKNNRYGHPTKEVMDRLVAHHVMIYSTIDDGTIELLSDGKTIAPKKTYAPATTVGGP